MQTAAFCREPFSPALWSESASLVVDHWLEIAHYPDIPLNPDLDAYLANEQAGVLRFYTARIEGELVGYAVFFVRANLHYKDSIQAAQDVLFVRADLRGGLGRQLIQWCDEQLRAEGVQVTYQHVKAAHNFGPMLERMGYELVDLIYAKRLDQPSVSPDQEKLRSLAVVMA